VIIIKAKIYTTIIIIFFAVFILNINAVQAESLYNWHDFVAKYEKNYRNNPTEISIKFKYAVGLANIGDIKKSYDFFDELDDELNQDMVSSKQKNKIERFLKLNNTRNLNKQILDNNLAGFAAVVFEDYRKAASFFENLIIIDPENLWSKNHLAAAYIEFKEYDKAEIQLDNAMEIKDNEYSHLLRGYIHYEKGNIIRALLEAGKSGELFKALINDD